MHIKTINAQAQHTYFYELNITKKKHKERNKTTPMPIQYKTT